MNSPTESNTPIGMGPNMTRSGTGGSIGISAGTGGSLGMSTGAGGTKGKSCGIGFPYESMPENQD
jgi:hypothetical protein